MTKLFDLEIDNIGELLNSYHKTSDKTYSEFVEKKALIIKKRAEIDNWIIDFLDTYTVDVGRWTVVYKGIEYIVVRGKYGIDFVVDKFDLNRFYIRSWKESVANEVLSELGGKFKLSIARPLRLQYFSIKDTYECIENGYLSEIDTDELDELIYTIQNYQNGNYDVSTVFGDYRISIVDGILNLDNRATYDTLIK